MIVLCHGASRFLIGRIQEAAQREGVKVVISGPSSSLEQEVEKVRPAIVFAQLDEEAIAAVRALRHRPDFTGIRVICFARTADGGLVKRAREAGCDEVLIGQRLARRLESLLGAE